MKRAGGGKAKGSAFERDVCKRLSLYVTRGASDDVFWRSAMSGGRATVSARKERRLSHVSGDLCATHPDGYGFIEGHYVECKYYKDLQYRTLVTSLSGLVVRFWEVAQREAKSNDKKPVLILKQNQMPILVGIHELARIGNAGSWKCLPRVIVPALRLHLYDFEELFYYENKTTSNKKSTTKPSSSKKQPNHLRPTLNVQSKRRV